MAGHTMYSINDLSLTARSQLLIQIIISILYNVCSYYYIIFSDCCNLLFFLFKRWFLEMLRSPPSNTPDNYIIILN